MRNVAKENFIGLLLDETGLIKKAEDSGYLYVKVVFTYRWRCIYANV